MPPKRAKRLRHAPRRFTPSTSTPSTPATSSWVVTPAREERRARAESPVERRARAVSPVVGNQESELVQSLQERVADLEASLAQASSSPGYQSDGQGEFVRMGSEALPLFTSLDLESAHRLENGEFLDFRSTARKSLQSRTDNRPLGIMAWSRTYLRVMSHMMEKGMASPQAMMVHMDTVLGLAEQNHQWDQYDTEFRRQMVNAGYSHAQNRVELYAKAVMRPHQQPFRGGRTPWRRDNASGIPLGSCYLFHSPAQRCNIQGCTYSHKCPHCGGRHPMYNCNRANSADNKRGDPQTDPKEKKQQK